MGEEFQDFMENFRMRKRKLSERMSKTDEAIDKLRENYNQHEQPKLRIYNPNQGE